MTTGLARLLLVGLAMLTVGGGTVSAQESTPAALSPVPAQYYELRGPGLFIAVGAPVIADVLPTLHIEYTYYPESASGGPVVEPLLFAYDGPPEQMQPFPGEGGNGWLLTVMVEALPDFQTVTLTLLLPAVNLPGGGAAISTVAIITTHPTSIAGPMLVDGPLQHYQVVPLTGTASEVGP